MRYVLTGHCLSITVRSSVFVLFIRSILPGVCFYGKRTGFFNRQLHCLYKCSIAACQNDMGRRYLPLKHGIIIACCTVNCVSGLFFMQEYIIGMIVDTS